MVKTLLATVLFAATTIATAQPVVAYQAKPGANFDDVRDDVKAAIEARGFVVDYQAQIGKMLARTGQDVGSTRALYVDAQSLQFCSARLSRKTMEADPGNVVMCPYTIVIYAAASDPQRVIVTYRRPMRQGGSPASRAALREIDALLDAIAREAAGRK